MNFKIFFLFIVLSSLSYSAVCQDNLPVPAGDKSQLFYLQRSTNANTIVYDLNYINGVLDARQPVHAFWILYAQKGEQDELNYIQRKFAYGIKTTKIADNDYELKFVSYDKYKLELKQGTDKQMHVYTTINNRNIILTRLYIKLNGGTFWFPKVEYVEVTGIDPTDNSLVKERMKV